MSKLLEYLQRIKGEKIRSDRPRSQSFSVVDVDERKQHVMIRFESGTSLYLHFRVFNAVIDYLVENQNRFVRIGATNKVSKDRDTLEWVIQQTDGSSTHTRRAPFVCDLLQVCGFVEYGFALNPYSGRMNQAVKWVARGWIK